MSIVLFHFCGMQALVDILGEIIGWLPECRLFLTKWHSSFLWYASCKKRGVRTTKGMHTRVKQLEQ